MRLCGFLFVFVLLVVLVVILLCLFGVLIAFVLFSVVVTLFRRCLLLLWLLVGLGWADVAIGSLVFSVLMIAFNCGSCLFVYFVWYLALLVICCLWFCLGCLGALFDCVLFNVAIVTVCFCCLFLLFDYGYCVCFDRFWLLRVVYG